MEAKEFQKMLKDDPELAQNLKEALDRKANLEELSGILVAAGVDPSTADELLAEYQRKRGAVIGTQELDDDELDQVAGGGTGNDCTQADDCDYHFKSKLYWDSERCATFNYCDEKWYCGVNWA